MSGYWLSRPLQSTRSASVTSRAAWTRRNSWRSTSHCAPYWTSNDRCPQHRQPRRKAIRFQAWPRPASIEDVISAKELAGQPLLITGLPLLRRILGQGSPLIEAGLIDPDGLKAAFTEVENGLYTEDPWSKLVEMITLDQAAGAFLP